MDAKMVFTMMVLHDAEKRSMERYHKPLDHMATMLIIKEADLQFEMWFDAIMSHRNPKKDEDDWSVPPRKLIKPIETKGGKNVRKK